MRLIVGFVPFNPAISSIIVFGSGFACMNSMAKFGLIALNFISVAFALPGRQEFISISTVSSHRVLT